MSKNLKSMTIPEIGAVLKELGQPAFRCKQVFTWLQWDQKVLHRLQHFLCPKHITWLQNYVKFLVYLWHIQANISMNLSPPCLRLRKC